MRTILWSVQLLQAIFCAALSFYFYLSHEDLDRDLIQPFELSEQLSKYMPFEIGMHISYTAFCFVSGHWLLAVLNIPLLVFNIRLYSLKQHKFHFFTHKEYAQGGRKLSNERICKYKTIFYIFLVVCTATKFLFNASNLMQYHTFGTTSRPQIILLN